MQAEAQEQARAYVDTAAWTDFRIDGLADAMHGPEQARCARQARASTPLVGFRVASPCTTQAHALSSEDSIMCDASRVLMHIME